MSRTLVIDGEKPSCSSNNLKRQENRIKIFMDVNKPLTTLRSMLEIVFRQNLNEYTFYLSDSKKLDDNKTLFEHHMTDQREGLVILTCEVKVSKANGKTINIIDVCKHGVKKVTYGVTKASEPPQESPEANQPPETFEEASHDESEDNVPFRRPLLWVHLLDLLTDWRHRKNIQWVGDGSSGEFRLLNPERVAYLWGMTKNNPNMTYAKMSRALYRYYNQELISKVPGKKHVYRFDLDLKTICGMSPAELQAEVIQAEIRYRNQL